MAVDELAEIDAELDVIDRLGRNIEYPATLPEEDRRLIQNSWRAVHGAVNDARYLREHTDAHAEELVLDLLARSLGYIENHREEEIN